MTTILVAGACALAFASVWELAGELPPRGRPRAPLGGRSAHLLAAASKLGLAARIRRAGLDSRIEPTALMAVKLAAAAAGGIAVALLALPAAPARLEPVIAALLVLGGFFAPDAALERVARRRHGRVLLALPDALDMLAVGAASGRGASTLLGELAAGGSGPLADELGAAVAEIECGASQGDALAGLRGRIGGAELGALVAALERSRTYGSPLAEQLHEQAGALRRDERRRIDERAARAAPKIQLVVALVLVPSVLLVILAAILAHSDALFGAL